MRWICGTLLVGAAVLKAAELVTVPTAGLVHPLGRYFLAVEIGLELALGMLLLSGLYWHAVRWFALVLFTGFAGYTLYLALDGADSCGCFGPIKIHPWWTFSLDVVVVAGLVGSILNGNRTSDVGGAVRGVSIIPTRHRQIVLTAMLGIVALGTVFLFRFEDERNVSAAGVLTTSGVVILEPEKWIGKPLPIADSINLELAEGDWIVLLHRHDCPACQEIVPQFEKRAESGKRVVLVEVPPYGEFEQRLTACKYDRLKDNREWFVQTPLEIHLHDGVVTEVHPHGH